MPFWVITLDRTALTAYFGCTLLLSILLELLIVTLENLYTILILNAYSELIFTVGSGFKWAGAFVDCCLLTLV